MSTAPFTFQPTAHEFVFKKKEYEGMRTVHEAPKSSQDLSLEFLSSYFHLRINDVAKKLGICATVLKKICRKNGIPRWPHRRIKSFEKRIELAQLAVSTSSGEERERLMQELAECQRQRDLLLKNPGLISKSLSRRNASSNINSSSHRLNDDAFDSDDHTSDDDSDNENENDNESPSKPQTHNQARRTLKVAKRTGPTKAKAAVTNPVPATAGPMIGSTSPSFGSPIISSSSSMSPVASLPQSSSALSLSSLGSSNSLSSANSNVSLSSTPNSTTHTHRSMNAAPLRKRQLAHEFESGVISSSSSSSSVPCPCCPNNAPVYRHASFAQQPTLRPPVIFAPAPAVIPAAVVQAPFDPLDAEAARTLQPLLDVINLAMFAESSLAPRV